MFLSRIELDVSRYDTRRAIASPQVIHAAVESCFSDKTPKERKLWRIDRLHNGVYLLLLSPKKPYFVNLSEQFCAPGTRGETKDYMPLLSCIHVGQRLRFRLRANPVRNSQNDKDKNRRGKVFAHVTIEQKLDWLTKRSASHGFSLVEGEFDVAETGVLRFSRHTEDRYVHIGYTVFEGVLVVTDAKLFTQSLTQGIGRAKAYGCGLMTVIGT